MAFELKNKTKRNIFYFSGILCYLLFMAGPIILDRNGLSQMSGICSAMQYASCLLLVKTNQRRGVATSIILLLASALNLVRVLVFSHSQNTSSGLLLSGLLNQVFYLVTIIWFGVIFAKQEKAAVTDLVTGLLNNRGFLREVKNSVEDAQPFWLVDIELGNFKLLNDSYGHMYGDVILKEVTKRITDFVGKRGKVARKSGAEFVVILNQTADAEKDANELLGIIREKIELPFGIDNMYCYVTPYAGIVAFPGDAGNSEDLIKFADMALVEAVRGNHSEASVFRSEMEMRTKRQTELEHLIKEGLENDYFFLVYQPQYMLSGKKLRGFETLLRMRLPDGSMVSPVEFIPVAEMSGKIISIDDYVLRRAMNEYKDIVLNKNRELVICVNVSAQNIASTGFPEKVRGILAETGFPAKNLEIEITEYCMVSSVNTTIKNIMELRRIGVQFALDDFGTGYTSLNYLSQLPVNLLKIDKSLIDNIETDPKRCEFVNAIISMGHIMGCEVISEGVENDHQLEKLSENSCDFIQGFVWGRPLDYAVAKELSVSHGGALR